MRVCSGVIGGHGPGPQFTGFTSAPECGFRAMVSCPVGEAITGLMLGQYTLRGRWTIDDYGDPQTGIVSEAMASGLFPDSFNAFWDPSSSEMTLSGIDLTSLGTRFKYYCSDTVMFPDGQKVCREIDLVDKLDGFEITRGLAQLEFVRPLNYPTLRGFTSVAEIRSFYVGHYPHTFADVIYNSASGRLVFVLCEDITSIDVELAV